MKKQQAASKEVTMDAIRELLDERLDQQTIELREEIGFAEARMDAKLQNLAIAMRDDMQHLKDDMFGKIDSFMGKVEK